MDENIGQYNAGAVTFNGSVYFNVGGSLITAAQASTTDLERLCEAHKKEISSYGLRSFAAFFLCYAVVVLCLPGAYALLWLEGVDKSTMGYKPYLLKVWASLAVPVLMTTLFMLSDWWREQRDILRVLKRARAEIRAQMGVRRRLEMPHAARSEAPIKQLIRWIGRAASR